MAQIFVGKRTLVTDVFPLKSQKQFVNTLEDNIRFRGAMTKLVSDYAKVEISNKLRTYSECAIAPVGTFLMAIPPLSNVGLVSCT